MILNPYLIIIAFTLMIFFPALKCLIIVDDVRWYAQLKQGHWAWTTKITWSNSIRWITSRLYSGGTFVSFEDCPTCDGNKVIIAENKSQKCARCRGEGKVEWQRKIFDRSITGIHIDHLFSIVLTVIVGTLMYLDFHSLWACLLFLSSSIVTHIAVWLNGRRYAINIILVLLMVACINAGGYWPILALPLYALTPYFHMTALFMPVLYPWSIPLIIVLLVMFWKKIHHQITLRQDLIVDGCERKYLKPNRIIVVIKTYGFYFFKMIMPLQTRTCYGFLYMWGETPEGNKDAYNINFAFWKGITAVLLTAIACFLVPKNLVAYVLFMFLGTIQWCNIISTNQITADRYICLPLVFMSVILAYFLPWQVCLVMVAINVAFTSQSYRMYENVQGMFDYHFYHWPNITLVNKEYIAFCIKTGNYIKAYTLTRECLRFNPTDFSLLHAAAVCARVANERVTARKYVDLAEKHLYYGQEDVQKRWIANFKASL